jgi:hypothetical protein
LYHLSYQRLADDQDLVSYELHQFPQFTISQCSAPSGARCGALFLDLGFEELVCNKIGRTYQRVLTTELLQGVREFFTHLKVEFNPTSPDCQDEFLVPFPEVPDIPKIGIQAGYLTLKK